MSLTSRNPLRMIGGIVYSGAPNTGEQRMTRGGDVVFTVYSGGALSPGSGFPAPVAQTGDQIKLWSGAGRLNTVIPLAAQMALSGVALTFYDAGAVAASGPGTVKDTFRVLGSINVPQGQSGLTTFTTPYYFDMPFTSGLCVAAISGTTGFSCSFSVEVNPAVG